jgi:hypothetical protein
MKTKPPKNPKDPKGTSLKAESKTLIGQILVELGYITIYQLDEALNIQRNDAELGKSSHPCYSSPD